MLLRDSISSSSFLRRNLVVFSEMEWNLGVSAPASTAQSFHLPEGDAVLATDLERPPFSSQAEFGEGVA